MGFGRNTDIPVKKFTYTTSLYLHSTQVFTLMERKFIERVSFTKQGERTAFNVCAVEPD